ncbi:MAG: hypothetical protein AAGC81_14900 [Pseudomonadota bacterium]
MKTYMLALSVMLSLTALPVSAITFEYEGTPFEPSTGSQAAGLSGPISGFIVFDDQAFLPNQTLDEADVVDFRFSSDGFVFTFAESTFFFARFDVNGAGSGIDRYGFTTEQNVTGDSRIDEISFHENSPFYFGDSFQVFTIDDSLAGDRRVSNFGSFSQTLEAGTLEVVPLPAPALFLLTGLLALGSLRLRLGWRSAPGYLS